MKGNHRRTLPEERETIINFNEAEDMASVYTHSHKWIEHIEKKLSIKPFRRLEPAREYEIPKKWLRLPQKPRTASPTQKDHLSKIRKVKTPS